MFDDATLAATSAIFNVGSTLLLLSGRAAVKRGDRELHRKLMSAAILTSALFLVAYGSRWILFEPRKFAGDGAARAVYLTILIPHMVLAMAVPYVALRAAFLARAGRLAEHVRLVRWGWPLWLYVSLTGVIVYAMLYHWPA